MSISLTIYFTAFLFNPKGSQWPNQATVDINLGKTSKEIYNRTYTDLKHVFITEELLLVK